VIGTSVSNSTLPSPGNSSNTPVLEESQTLTQPKGQEITGRDQNNNVLDHAYLDMAKEYHILKVINVELNHENHELKEFIGRRKEYSDGLKKTISVLQEDIASLREENAKLKAAPLYNYNAMKHAHKIEINALRIDRDHVREQLTHEKGLLEISNRDLENQNAGLREQLERSQQSLQDCEGKIAELSMSEVDNLFGEQAGEEYYEELLQELGQELCAVRKDLQKRDDEFNNLKNESNVHREDLQAAWDQVFNLRNENEELKKHLEEAEELNALSVDQAIEINELQEAHDDLFQQVKELPILLDENDELREQLRQRDEEIAQLKEDLAQANRKATIEEMGKIRAESDFRDLQDKFDERSAFALAAPVVPVPAPAPSADENDGDLVIYSPPAFVIDVSDDEEESEDEEDEVSIVGLLQDSTAIERALQMDSENARLHMDLAEACDDDSDVESADNLPQDEEFNFEYEDPVWMSEDAPSVIEPLSDSDAGTVIYRPSAGLFFDEIAEDETHPFDQRGVIFHSKADEQPESSITPVKRSGTKKFTDRLKKPFRKSASPSSSSPNESSSPSTPSKLRSLFSKKKGKKAEKKPKKPSTSGHRSFSLASLKKKISPTGTSSSGGDGSGQGSLMANSMRRASPGFF